MKIEAIKKYLDLVDWDKKVTLMFNIGNDSPIHYRNSCKQPEFMQTIACDSIDGLVVIRQVSTSKREIYVLNVEDIQYISILEESLE